MSQEKIFKTIKIVNNCFCFPIIIFKNTENSHFDLSNKLTIDHDFIRNHSQCFKW